MDTAGFAKVKGYLNELGLAIIKEVADDDLFIVQDEDNGINNLVIDVEDPIVVLEQFIMDVPKRGQEHFYRRLLQMNRALVHGAFVLDEELESGKKLAAQPLESGKNTQHERSEVEAQRVYFRDTLQLQNLDLNELEGSIKALSLGLAEVSSELIEFSKN